MLMRFRLHGSGSTTDPVRAQFPTYALSGVDAVGGTLVVAVPDDHLPPGLLQDTGTVQVQTVYGPAITAMSQAMANAWQALVNQKHPNPPQPYDFNLV